ncbi:hypothetical protein [Streptomyces radiopugnans]|uniref:hypothetical protein n=1 Tax=Streptomyces radiopugnans TaxID=403935 RepID=UPI003F19DCC2
MENIAGTLGGLVIEQQQQAERVDGLAAGQAQLTERASGVASGQARLTDRIGGIEEGQTAILDHLWQQTAVLARLDPAGRVNDHRRAQEVLGGGDHGAVHIRRDAQRRPRRVEDRAGAIALKSFPHLEAERARPDAGADRQRGRLPRPGPGADPRPARPVPAELSLPWSAEEADQSGTGSIRRRPTPLSTAVSCADTGSARPGEKTSQETRGRPRPRPPVRADNRGLRASSRVAAGRGVGTEGRLVQGF